MNTRTFTYLSNLLWAASLVILSGCYTVLLHQPARVADSESGPVEPDSTEISFQDHCITCHGNDFHEYEFAANIQPYGLLSSRWTAYYEGAEPWWRNMPGYDSSDDQTMSNTANNMRRHYGRRREALNDKNSSSSLTAGYISTGSSIPSSVSTFVAAPLNVDSSKLQNTKASGSDNQPSKSKPQNTQREYGARETARKK